MIDAFDKAVHDKLAGTSAVTTHLAAGTAGVFLMVARPGADPPYVVFNRQAQTPRRVIGGGAVAFENVLYQVKAITKDQSALAGTIAAAIDTALDNQALTIAGYVHMSTLRESQVDFPEPSEGGPVYYHRGGLYRIHADPA